MPLIQVIGVYRPNPEQAVHIVELTVRGADKAFTMGEFTQERPDVPRSRWEVAHLEQILNADGTRIVADDSEAWRKPELFRGDVRLVFLFRSLDLHRPLGTPFGEVPLPDESEVPERLKLVFSAVNPVTVMTWRTRMISIAAAGLALAALQLAFFDSVRQSPKWLHPARLFFNSFIAFVCVNILAFGLNVIQSLASIRGCKDERKIEEVMAPAYQGYIANQRILRYTDVSFFACLGAMLAAALLWLFR